MTPIPPNPVDGVLAPPAFDAADAEGRSLTSADLGAPIASSRGAAAWTVVGFGLMQVLRLGFNLTLAQLVAPRVFGVMAIVNVFLQLLHMVSDLGIRQCVIAHPRGDDPVFLRTAWTMQVVRGLILWALSAAIAWPVAAFYEDDHLLWLIPVAGLTAVLDGVSSANVFTLSRRLMRGRLVMVELGSYTLSMILVVIAEFQIAGDDPAHDGLKLAALIAGGILSCALQSAASYFLYSGVATRFAWDRDAARDLWHYGGWIFLNTACFFLASQIDRLVIGRKADKSDLGVYNLAAQLSLLPLALIYELCNQLALPLYARVLAGDDGRTRIRTAHRLMGALAAYITTGLIAVGPTFFRAFFKPDYQGAGFWVQLLAAGTWFSILQYTNETVLIATRHSRPLAFAQMAKLTLLIPSMMIGWHYGGLVGLVIGFKVPEVFRYLILAVLVHRRGFSLYWDDFALTVLIAAGVLLTYFGGEHLWTSVAGIKRFGLEVGVVTTYWLAVFGVMQIRARAG